MTCVSKIFFFLKEPRHFICDWMHHC